MDETFVDLRVTRVMCLDVRRDTEMLYTFGKAEKTFIDLRGTTVRRLDARRDIERTHNLG